MTLEQGARVAQLLESGLDMVDACYPDADRAAALICGPSATAADLAATAARVAEKWAARVAASETPPAPPVRQGQAVGA